MKRAAELLAWGLPPIVCLALFHQGLFSWFVQDDFGSLLLAMRTHSFADLAQWATQPLGQGVWRPLPDALFYVALYKLAGLNAFPYRVAVFATHFANLLLLTAVLRRLTDSAWSGLTGTLVWTVNVALVVAMVWTSAYSQVLSCFFWLSGFYLFLKHLETGRWSFWWAQCAAFLLGLATLEIGVMYPAVLLVYCLLLARRHMAKVVPMLGIAATYGAISLWAVRRAESGPYVMYFDSSLWDGLWRYWTTALGAFIYSRDMPVGPAGVIGITTLLTVGLAWAAARANMARRRVALLGLAWFFLTLAPVLPLRDQRMDYYLTVPTIGLGMAAAALLAPVPRWAAGAWLAVYGVCSVTFIPAGLDYWYQRSQVARRLLEGAREARDRHPGRVLLLSGVNGLHYYAAIYDLGLAAVGVSNAFLLPDASIPEKAGFQSLEKYQISPEAAVDVLSRGDAEVYRVGAAGGLENVTAAYRASHPGGPALPTWVDLGLPGSATALGEGWWGASGGVRWMNRRAEIRLRGPEAGSRLRLRAIYPYRGGAAVHLSVSANGVHVGTAAIRDPASSEHVFPVPASLVGAPELNITLEADRTFRTPPDVRDLAVAFGVIELI